MKWCEWCGSRYATQHSAELAESWCDGCVRVGGGRGGMWRDAPNVAAARTLAEVSRGAWDTGTETPDGRAVWMHDDHPRARFVVARPERRASGAWGLPTLVTVLPLEFAESRRARGMKR